MLTLLGVIRAETDTPYHITKKKNTKRNWLYWFSILHILETQMLSFVGSSSTFGKICHLKIKEKGRTKLVFFFFNMFKGIWTWNVVLCRAHPDIRKTCHLKKRKEERILSSFPTCSNVHELEMWFCVGLCPTFGRVVPFQCRTVPDNL